jgi:HSP20 family protein
MNRRSLIPWNFMPWNRNRGEVSRANEGASSFLALHREMNRMFDDFARNFDAPARASSSWPCIEISETGDEIHVIAEVPGFDKRDVEVTLHDGVLTLRGGRKLERNGTVYSERWEGAFERDIPVGEDVDPDKVRATTRNGVLTISLSKKPESQREVKRIAVN